MAVWIKNRNHLGTAAVKCGTLCLFTLACAAALHADLSRMAVALFIINTIRSLAVNCTRRRCLFHGIAVRIAILILLKAVTARLLGTSCISSAHLNLIQITVVLFVVHTCLHSTS